MPVSYSIASGTLTLDPVQQLGFEQIPVWDGPTYLYTIFRLHFRGTYNPATFSWNLQGPDGAKQAFNVPGQVAPVSNAATRHFLMQPRGQLIYSIGVDPGANPVIAVISPTNVLGTNNTGSPVNYVTDAANGPVPLHCNVVEVRGSKTFIVDWAIETYVNECFLFKSSTSLSALLSHRWTVEEDLDQDFFSTRTIRGHAIFRSDRLLALTTIPDDYRAWLFAPVWDNFQRTVQQAIPSPDGTRLDYVLVDREKAFNLVPGVVQLGVTRIEAFYRQGYSRKIGIEEGGIRLTTVINEASALAPLGAVNDPFIGARAAIKLRQEAVNTVLDAVPRYTQNLVVRVWGNRTSTRANLGNVALAVFATRVGIGVFALGSGSIDLGEDLMGKFVELNCNLQSGPIEGLLRIGAYGFVSAPAISPDEMTSITQSQPTPNPLPSYDNGTRETPYSVMAQVLAGSCGLTPRPFNRPPQSNTP